MARRTQITLSDGQYARLKEESERSGASMSELVRRAVERTFGFRGSIEPRRGLEESFGAWEDRDLDGARYVDQLRRGLGRRLAQ